MLFVDNSVVKKVSSSCAHFVLSIHHTDDDITKLLKATDDGVMLFLFCCVGDHDMIDGATREYRAKLAAIRADKWNKWMSTGRI
jgi:hypothetical protein